MNTIKIIDTIPIADDTSLIVCLLFLLICELPTLLMLEYIKHKYGETLTKKCAIPFVWMIGTGLLLTVFVESPAFENKTSSTEYIIQIDPNTSYQEVTQEWNILEQLPNGTYLAEKKGN